MVPPRLAAFTDVKRWLPGHVWHAIEQRYSDRVLGSCQVTTLPSLPMFPNEVRPPLISLINLCVHLPKCRKFRTLVTVLAYAVRTQNSRALKSVLACI